MNIKDLKNICDKNNSTNLDSLRRLFAFMDYLNDEYKKDNDGKENPYWREEENLNGTEI